MFKTLKSKFAAVYVGLVIIIAVIGILSTHNNYTLGKQINSLMVRNYKSIKAINNMIEALEEQNGSVLTYINISHDEGIHNFHFNEVRFNENYYIESNNITEPGEDELVKELNATYERYLTLFSEFQEVYAQKDINSSIDFYKSNILPEYDHLKKTLNSIALLNETGMFSSKDRVTAYAKKSLYIILMLSSLSVLIGFLVSMISLRRFLHPLYSLRETMKAVKEGDLNQQAPIISEDEIGDLTIEFNNMTKRLLQFEQSTLGQILAEKNKSDTIVKSISDPLIVLDTNYKVVLLNKACESIFNIKESEALNKYFLQVIDNGDLYDYIHSVNNSDSRDTVQKIIYLNVNGNDYYFNIIVNILKDARDKSSGSVVLFQNVTQLKQIEKIKSDFIATISHEFKTPLTSIMIGTSLITDKKIGELNEKQREIAATIAEDSERLLTLVNDLLNLSKLESGKSIFDISSHSISEIIETSIKGFTEQSNNRGISIQYDKEENLPKVNVDFEKVTWVLNNLISNALRYTDQGDKILIKAFVEQNKMCVSVKDTGIGIPSSYVEKIFDKFIQVEGQDSEMKGTGLGLAIAKEIVEAHGGEIWCISKLNHGSIFTFTLPLSNFSEGDS